MDRFTRKDADAAFRRLCKATGHEEGPNWRRVDWAGETGPEWAGRSWRNVAQVGTWYLDYNPIYGGCVVHEIVSEGGGVTTPFGSTRLTPREFCHAVNFAIRALESLDTATTDQLPARLL